MSRTPAEIAEAYTEHGTPADPAELLALCALAEACEQADAKLEALEEALAGVGLKVIDTTTDDDDGATVLEIVNAAEHDG